MHNYDAKLVDSSRIIADLLVKDIGDSQERFDEMLEITLRDSNPISMRASRIIALCSDKYPQLINPHISALIEKLGHLKNEGVKRGILKIFAEHKLPITEDDLGLLTDLAFKWLEDHSQAIAIRYYCIEILLKVCKTYPDLLNELTPILSLLKETGSPGLQAVSIQILSKLSKKNRA